jgi:hypothetical protein
MFSSVYRTTRIRNQVTIVVVYQMYPTLRWYPLLRGPFANFVDSPYYSESELCGDAVTVSFSKYLPWQAMHFLQRSTHFSKTCCRPLITSKFLALELPRMGRERPGLYGGCSDGVPPIQFSQAEHRIKSYFNILD